MIDILVLYIIALFVKLLAYKLSGYTAILADALHSVVDIAMIAFLIISAKISSKAADLSHPFGHDLAKNVASLVIAVSFITVVSFELIKEGIYKIISPPEAYANTGIAIASEIVVLGLVGIATIISMRRAGVLNKTILFENINDLLSTLAAIFGVAMVWFGYKAFDGIATVFIALLIAANSLRLLRENAVFLIGLSPPEEFYKRVEKVCLSVEGVKGVHDMLGVYVGENAVHLDLHVTVDGNMTINEADKLSVIIAEKLKKEIPEIKHVVIHFCPHIGEKRKLYR